MPGCEPGLLYFFVSFYNSIINSWNLWISRSQRGIGYSGTGIFSQYVESTSEILDNDLDYIEEFSLKMNADDRLYEIFQQIDMEDEVELEKASDQIAPDTFKLSSME